MKKIFTLIALLAMSIGAWAAEWSINFATIGDNNKLADKAGATISAEVSDGMGTVTLGEALNANFGIQTNTTWIYRTASKGLYSSNGGGRNFGVFNAIKDQVITLNISDAPTPTNATLQSTNGNVRVYKVTANGTVKFNLARYNTIYSISVENPSATDVNYTVKYVDADGNELKTSSTKTGAPGSAITIGDVEKTSIYANNKKYIYASDDSSGKTIAADGSTVVTLTFREAATYAVNAKYNGNVISTVNAFEADDAKLCIPYYQFAGGVLYTTPSVDKGTLSYGQITVSNVTANTDVTVSYTEDAVQNAVFFSEAENISTLTPYTDGYTQIRMSNGSVAYAAADGAVIANLPAGKYTLTSNTRAGTTKFYAGSNEILSLESKGAVVTTTSDEFTLNETTDITVNAGSNAAYFDYVLIRKTGDVTPASSVTYATLYMSIPCIIPENAEAFTAKLSGNKLILSKLEGSIPAGTPVILKSGGESTSSTTGTATENDLKGTFTEIATSSITEGTVCVLGKVDGVWGFYKYTGEKLAANKAYLVVPDESAAKGITLVFDNDVPTGINNVSEAKNTVAAKKFFENGQLLIKTANGIIDAAGSRMK